MMPKICVTSPQKTWLLLGRYFTLEDSISQQGQDVIDPYNHARPEKDWNHRVYWFIFLGGTHSGLNSKKSRTIL